MPGVLQVDGVVGVVDDEELVELGVADLEVDGEGGRRRRRRRGSVGVGTVESSSRSRDEGPIGAPLSVLDRTPINCSPMIGSRERDGRAARRERAEQHRFPLEGLDEKGSNKVKNEQIEE